MALKKPEAIVLLVDDDPMITALLGAYFPEDHFRVLTAELLTNLPITRLASH